MAQPSLEPEETRNVFPSEVYEPTSLATGIPTTLTTHRMAARYAARAEPQVQKGKGERDRHGSRPKQATKALSLLLTPMNEREQAKGGKRQFSTPLLH